MNTPKSLYIQTENQELLWEMLHKTPQLVQVFPHNNSSSQKKKETWFRGIIADFHNKTPIIQNREQLLAMNRQTLSYMMNQLSSFIATQQPQRTQPPQPQMQQSQQQMQQSQQQMQQQPQRPMDSVGTTYSRNIQTENREDIYKRQFEEREREYKAMSAPPELPKVNFALSEDIAISNISELVEQHRRLRELDVQPIIPSPSVIENNVGSQNMKLKLQEDLPTETIRLDAVSLDSFVEKRNDKRQVTWNDDHLVVQSNDMKKEMDEMRADINELKQIVFRFIEKVDLNIEKREPTENTVTEENTEIMKIYI